MKTQLTRRELLIATSAAACSRLVRAQPADSGLAPYGAIPSTRQLRWQRLETYAFLHFTVNTFTDREWGNGDEDPNVFNPTDFDPDSIMRGLKVGGLKAVILTCKHHDGFCLWPTKTTEHCIRNSSWRGGKGDVVGDLAAAARRAGLPFGVYVSPWDRSNALYATPEYLPLYREQIRELLSNYGPIFEVWFDGANGGDGYYGGAREKRVIDKAHYYEWPKTFAMIRDLQPQAVIFCPDGDLRWVGNEKGIAGDPCWATFGASSTASQDQHASDGGSQDELMHGAENGPVWRPAECDVSIRPGWFWHQQENSQVKTPQQLVDLYFESVGRGASLLLNVPPNRKGQLEVGDAQSLAAFHERLDRIFAENVAASATLKASNVRAPYSALNLVDGNPDTCWATQDGVLSADVVLTLPRPETVATMRIREGIAYGQRVRAFAVDVWVEQAWKQIVTGTSIGACRLLRLPATSPTSRVRLRILKSDAPIVLSEWSVYAPPHD